jgi:hypothetical protein
MKVSQLKEVIRNIVHKKLSEATIDVTNPGTLTPQAKQQLITKARNSTKNQKIGTADDPAEFIEEETDNTPKKYTVDVINKMSKAELADFIGLDLTPSELRNYSYSNLYGAARELADDKADYENLDELGDADISQGYMPTTNLSPMSRQDMLDILQLDPNTPENEISNEELRLGLKMYSDIYGELNEKFYSDDDDTVMYEDVEDIDSSGDDMAKYYDEIYEEEVAPGSFYQISIEPHPMNPGLIILSQDNGQTIVVNREDINALINILRKLA